jgi:hypothetical protein
MTAPRRYAGVNPPGRVPAAMLRAVAAEVSDPARFGRAKTYARDGAVFDIEVEPGEARGLVQGSRYEPYIATVYAAPAEELGSLVGAVPEADELMAMCSCPDDSPGGFCKHALATLLVLADEITIEPDVLTTWRSGDRHPALPPRADGPTIDVLATWLRAPADLPALPDLPPRVPVPVRGHPELAACLADAQAILRAG